MSLQIEREDYREADTQRLQRPDKFIIVKAFMDHCVDPETSAAKPVKLQTIYPDYTPFTIDEKFLVLASPEMYQEAPHIESIHGAGHQARVAVMGKGIGIIEGLKPRESDLVFVAGELHDTQRVIDNDRDLNHGLRASIRIDETLFRRKIDEFLLEHSGRVPSREEIEIIKIMCQYHEHDYETIDPGIRKEYGRFLIPMMNADRLDRFRSPSQEWWPDPKYFLPQVDGQPSTAAKLYEFAQYFSLGTEVYRLGFNTDVARATRVMAKEVGLIAA